MSSAPTGANAGLLGKLVREGNARRAAAALKAGQPQGSTGGHVYTPETANEVTPLSSKLNTEIGAELPFRSPRLPRALSLGQQAAGSASPTASVERAATPIVGAAPSTPTRPDSGRLSLYEYWTAPSTLTPSLQGNHNTGLNTNQTRAGCNGAQCEDDWTFEALEAKPDQAGETLKRKIKRKKSKAAEETASAASTATPEADSRTPSGSIPSRAVPFKNSETAASANGFGRSVELGMPLSGRPGSVQGLPAELVERLNALSGRSDSGTYETYSANPEETQDGRATNASASEAPGGPATFL